MILYLGQKKRHLKALQLDGIVSRKCDQPSKAFLLSCTDIFLALPRSLCLTYLEITLWYCINHQAVTNLGSILNPKPPYTWTEEAASL